jgi:hydroxymethylbilane synthase
MAQKGVWVHGCSEGLGEQEESRIDILAGKSLSWAKLTHDTGYEEGARQMPLVATYTLGEQNNATPVTGKECFFWSSGSQFLDTAKKHPEVLGKHHACGPGNTFKIIRQYLQEQGHFTESKLNIYLDQENWRQQCTR